MHFRPLFLLLICATALSACQGQPAASGLREDFERGTKRGYEGAVVALASGAWRLDGALIGKTTQDRKSGEGALRIAASGAASMTFDMPPAAYTVRLSAGAYGNDDAPQLALWYSTDRGTTWSKAGAFKAAAGAGLSPSDVAVPGASGKGLRLSIRNEGSGRANADDLLVSRESLPPAAGPGTSNPLPQGPPTPQSGRGDHLLLGNPSGAKTDPASADNYLLRHPQFVLSYSASRHIPAWVAWHLSSEWMGAADRCNCFAPDATLPQALARAMPDMYAGTGFDRGHLCPSADRTASRMDNAATFLMTNMAPQAHNLNGKTWERLEAYCRALAARDMELYIMAGAYGEGGVNDDDIFMKQLPGGRVAVPARFWKIIVVLPKGENDLKRITAATRVIAVDMPNVPAVSEHTWNYYRTTVAAIEAATGYRFFSALPADVRAALRQKVDGGLRSGQ